MRRRAIISIILSVIVFILTMNVWLNFRPLNFEMNISSDKQDEPVRISLLLNRKSEPNYTKPYDECITIDLKNTNHCEIVFRHKTPPKRFKLTLENIIPDTEYILSDIAFKRGKYKIEDLSLFASGDAKLTVKDNCLIIIPNKSTITLENNMILNIKRSVKFDLKMFLIIGILSYLLFYKLTSYLADFKLNKNASRLDIIFLVICTVLLFIPVSNINQDDISKKENRMLANYHPLFDKDNNLNFNYGKDYEAWFNDRFGCRDILVDLFRTFQFNIVTRYYQNKKAYLDKKTNWTFHAPLVFDEYPKEELDSISTSLIDYNNFCNKNNIKLYVFVIPEKNHIYKRYTYLTKDFEDSYLKTVKYIKEKTGVSIIYPYDEMMEASKSDYVFFKTDHHWTDYGVYVSYKTLMKEINKDFPNIKPEEISNFEIVNNKSVKAEWEREFTRGHNLAYILNIDNKYADKILDVEYKYFIHKNSNLLKTKTVKNDDLGLKEFEYPKGAKLRVLLTGTSMNENLSDILPYSFNQIRYIRLNTGTIPVEERYKVVKRYKNHILDFKPDIMIFCITAGDMPGLKDLMKEE